MIDPYQLMKRRKRFMLRRCDVNGARAATTAVRSGVTSRDTVTQRINVQIQKIALLAAYNHDS
jgi:hypothetical protein